MTKIVHFNPKIKEIIEMCERDKRSYVVKDGKVFNTVSGTEYTLAILRAIKRSEESGW